MTACLVLLVVAGCGSIFKPTVVKHPDAPVVVVKSYGLFFKGALWDDEKHDLIPAGYFWFSDYKGWTICKINWDKKRQDDLAKQAAQLAVQASGPAPIPVNDLSKK